MIPKTKMGKQSDLTGFDKHYEEDNDLADLAEYV